MNVSLRVKDLKDVLDKLMLVIPKKCNEPIYSKVLVDVHCGIVDLYATDNRIFLRETLTTINGVGPMKFTVHAASFRDTITSLHKAKASLVDLEHNYDKLIISGNGTSVLLPTGDSSYFPMDLDEDKFKYNFTISVNTGSLIEHLKNVHAVISDKDCYGVNETTLFTIDKTNGVLSNVEVAATDTIRLCVDRFLIGSTGVDKSFRFALPSAAIKPLYTILDKETSAYVSMMIGEFGEQSDHRSGTLDGSPDVIRFRSPCFRATVKTIGSPYFFNYNHIIPNSFRYLFTVRSEDLIDAIDMVLPIAKKKNNREVSISFNNHWPTGLNTVDEYGNTSSAAFLGRFVDTNGNQLDVLDVPEPLAFNCEALKNILKRFDDDIVFGFTDDTLPFLVAKASMFLGSDDWRKELSSIYVQMPIKGIKEQNE